MRSTWNWRNTVSVAEIQYLLTILNDRLVECQAGLWTDEDLEGEVKMLRQLLRRLKKMEQTEAIPF